MALPSLIGGNLLNSQTPLSFLLAVFPMLFVCSDLTRWRLETGQGGEGFGICPTRGSAGEYQADEWAGIARTSWRLSGR